MSEKQTIIGYGGLVRRAGRLWSGFLTAALFLLLVGCDGPGHSLRDATAEIGMRVLIKRAGRDYIAEVTDVRGPLVSMALEWQGRLLLEREYYRGLYPVSGFEGGQHFVLDYDAKKLDAFFPLTIGAMLDLTGNLKLIERDEILGATIKMHVTGQQDINISGVIYPSYIVDIETQYNRAANSQKILNRVYYSSELSLILKSITYENGPESFWRVVGIEHGDTAPRRRRSMTVAI